MSDKTVIADLFRSIAVALDEGMEAKAIIARVSRDYGKAKVAVVSHVDIATLSSNCCGCAVVASFGDSTFHYYRCIKCGDPCDPFAARTATAKAAASRRPPTHECCGSRNWRHKANCPERNDGERPRPWSCDECRHSFTGTSPDFERCPKCGSDNTWPDT